MSTRRGRTRAPAPKRGGAKTKASAAPTRRTARVPGTAGSAPVPRLARPGAASPARELSPLARRSTGPQELVGIGELQRALADYQRAQDREANRAWRRPGGLARMGLV